MYLSKRRKVDVWEDLKPDVAYFKKAYLSYFLLELLKKNIFLLIIIRGSFSMGTIVHR